MNSNTLKKVVITTLASIVVSAGVYFFMVPYNLTIGGTAGLSIALSKFFPEISVGVFQVLAYRCRIWWTEYICYYCRVRFTYRV